MTRQEKIEQLWRTAMKEGWTYKKYCEQLKALTHRREVKA